MQEDPLEAFFRSLTASPSATLAAPALLKQRITSDPQFLPAFLEQLGNGEERVRDHELYYFHAITLLHPVLIEAFADLPSALQEEVRSGLLSAVVALHASLRSVGALALLIREMLEVDSLEPWLQPLGELVKWSGSDDVAIMHAGIEFFLQLLRETAYTQSNADLPLFRLAPLLLENLFQVFAHAELSEAMREKLLYLVLQLVKTFSMLDGLQDDVVRECFDETFELWMSIFISALQGSITLNLGIKKYIVKTLVVIFRDMQRYLAARKYAQPAHIFVIWEFSYKILPLYLWSHVWQRPVADFPLHPKASALPTPFPYFDDDADALCSPLESLALAVLEFLSVLTSIPQLQNAVRLSTHHLSNLLFHFMLLGEGELAGWRGNPQHFTSQGASYDYELTVRSKCLAILNELIEKFGDLAIQALLVVSEKFLLNLDEEATSATLTMIAGSLTDLSNVQAVTGGVFESEGKFGALVRLSSCNVREALKVAGESWRKVEVSLLVLGRFAEDIIVFQSKQGGAFDIESFVRGIVRQVREEDYYSLLKGQSLYCLTRFTEIISIKYRQLFGDLALAAASCNHTAAPLPLRLIACKALSMFLKKIEKHKLDLTSEQLAGLEEAEVSERVVELPLMHETLPQVMEVLIELFRNRQLRSRAGRLPPDYFLALFHQCLAQQSLVTAFVGLLDGVCEDFQTFSGLLAIFAAFTGECLRAFSGILRSEQKKFLKAADTELILTALRVVDTFIRLSAAHDGTAERERLVELVGVAVEILEVNEDVQVQVALSLFLKGVLRTAADLIADRKDLVEQYVSAVRTLLRVPRDKSFESASVYAGNLTVLVFEKLLRRNHNEILQEIVLKVFRSRTPSVIQSLVLVYSRLINQGTTQSNKFRSVAELEANARSVVDFLSSFSIENRMGLKILIDKWLLQQSLFRGKFTKIATFMALSKLFLLSDKRVDNLLVIGFNPSHTNVNNDVNAPLKILATLIRCLDNELSGSQGRGGDSEDEEEAEGREEGLEVNLEKFKEEERPEEEARVGGLADRENQQGSTCYMSAMLEFYDDGEECDDKTEEDLIYLKDTSTNFTLSEYLTQFFQFLAAERGQYLRECLKGLLLKDTRTLQKYIKL